MPYKDFKQGNKTRLLYSDFPIISTVPIKGTVLEFSISSLINVQYNLKNNGFSIKRTVPIKRIV